MEAGQVGMRTDGTCRRRRTARRLPLPSLANYSCLLSPSRVFPSRAFPSEVPTGCLWLNRCKGSERKGKESKKKKSTSSCHGACCSCPRSTARCGATPALGARRAGAVARVSVSTPAAAAEENVH